MANLRVLADNAADRATVTAGSGSSTVGNLQVDMKSAVWRSASGTTSTTLTLNWATAESINMVALAFCNLTATATVQLQGYTLPADAVPAVNVTRSAFNSVLAGPNHVCAYLPAAGNYRKLVITINDAGNPAGLLEVSRLVVGKYWSPVYTAEAGASVGVTDTSKSERTDAGDLFTERGPQFKTISFDLAVMPNEDRDAFYNILRTNGTYKPMFISLVPEDSDKSGEQMFQIYGKQTRTQAMKYSYYNMFATQVDIEEV